MQIIETKGNQNLMNREKTLFLCSKMTPIGLYGYIFNWTDSLTERDCIVCFIYRHGVGGAEGTARCKSSYLALPKFKCKVTKFF